MIKDDFYKQFKEHALQFENNKLELYFDTKGIPTIGVGFALLNKHDSGQKWRTYSQEEFAERGLKITVIQHKTLATYATNKSKGDDISALKQEIENWHLTIDATTSDKLFNSVIQDKHHHIISKIGEKTWDSLSTTRQVGIMDHCYHKGNINLLANHLKKGDFEAAANVMLEGKADFPHRIEMRAHYVKTDSTNFGEWIYVVKAGDSFSKIAMNHGLTQEELQALNPDININRISVGQQIKTKQSTTAKLSNSDGVLDNEKLAGECEGGVCVSSSEKSLPASTPPANLAPEPNHGLGYLVKVADLGSVVVASQKSNVLSNGNVVVLWVTHQDNYAEFAAFFQIHNKVGEKLTDPISISPAWDTDLAALNNGNFLIYGNKKLYCFDSSGQLLKTSILDHLKYDSYQITLTVTSDNRILLSWHDSTYDQNGVRSWHFKGKYYNDDLISLGNEFKIFHGGSSKCQLTAEKNSMIGIFCAEDTTKSGTGIDSLACRGASKKAFGCFGLLDTGQTADQKFFWVNWPIQKEEHTLLHLTNDKYVISENSSINNKLYAAIMDSKGKAIVTNLLDPAPNKYRINLSKINSHENNQEFLMTWETGEFHEDRSIKYQKFNENGTLQGEDFTINHLKGSNHHLATSYNEELYAISWLYSSYKQQNWFHSEYGYSSAWQNIKDFTTSIYMYLETLGNNEPYEYTAHTTSSEYLY